MYSVVLQHLADYGSILFACIFPGLRALRSRRKLRTADFPHVIFFFMDALRGATMFPFVLIVPGAFMPDFISALANSNKVTLVLAGVIGLVSVWRSDKWFMDIIEREVAKRTPKA